MQNNAKIMPTTEIFSAFASHRLPNEDISQLTENPHDYLNASYNTIIEPDIYVFVVQNTPQQVHLVLPYYSGISISGAVSLSDDDIENVVGGEFFASIIAIIVGGAAIGGAIGAGGAAIGLAFWEDVKQDRI